LESSPVYHIFQVVPSSITDGSPAPNASAEPGRPWSSTGTGPPPSACFVQVTPSTEVATDDAGYHGTAVLNWTPVAGALADTQVVVRVVDSRGGATYCTYSIAVAGGNHAPVIIGNAAVTLAEGASLNLPLVAADADGDPLTLTVRNLPPGARYDATSGLLQWTPGYDQAGTFKNVTVVASDGKVTVTCSFDIVVTQDYAAPVFDAMPAQTLREGEAWGLQLQGSVPGGVQQANGTTASLRWTTSWLPDGAALDPTTGWFSWTPSYAQHGDLTLPITLTATWQPADGSEPVVTRVTRDVTLHVLNANGAPQFAPSQTWNVLEGQMLRVSVLAFDPDNPGFVPATRLTPTATPTGGAGTSSITYSVAGLPPGASFDPTTLEIVWTPGAAQAGTYSVVVTATDDGDGTGTPLTSMLVVPIVVGNTNHALPRIMHQNRNTICEAHV